MFATTLAAVAFAMAMQSPPAGGDTYQATTTVCRPFPDSPIRSAPVCRGGIDPLAPAGECYCNGPNVRYDEPACWADGKPAMFKKGVRPTGPEANKLMSCADWQRNQNKSNP